MALGGGTFITQNKVLPGSFINFVSANTSAAQLAARGVGVVPMKLNWGAENEVFKVETAEVQSQASKLFGYDYTNENLIEVREVFKNAKTVYFYRLNKNGIKADNTFATAKYKGTRGNDITTVIGANIDNASKYDVKTVVDGVVVDLQTVTDATELIANDWVEFKNEPLVETAGLPLTSGSNGDEITGTEYQAFLDAIESYSFQTLACPSTDETIKALFVAFAKRMRDENGTKFQLVVYQMAADYEGVISVENTVTDAEKSAASLVYWVAGASAGCAVNKSNTNKKYDGEFTISTPHTQTQLGNCVKAGKFAFHKVDEDIHVLKDINTFVSFTVLKTEDFASNQTIRVLDQVALETASLFNKQFVGKVANDKSGRVSFWGQLVKIYEALQKLRAIQNFTSDDITVEKGEQKGSVVVGSYIEPTNAMDQLYMTSYVR